MPITAKYLFVASMDVDPDKEALFNEVYDTEHIPNLLKVPGVYAVTRIKGEPFAVSIDGAEGSAPALPSRQNGRKWLEALANDIDDSGAERLTVDF